MQYNYVIISAEAPQITGTSSVCSTNCLGADQRIHLSSAPLVFTRGIQRWPLDSLRKGPLTRKMFPFDYFIDAVGLQRLLGSRVQPQWIHVPVTWGSRKSNYAVNCCVSRWNGRDIFFHITFGRINTWKGVNQLKELFFLNLIIFF